MGGIPLEWNSTPNMVTKRFALTVRQIRVCVIFRPMGNEQTRVGAVLGKKAEPRHAVHPMGAGHDERTAPRRTEEGIDNCVLRVSKRFCLVCTDCSERVCLGLRRTASRESEVSRRAHYSEQFTISSRETTSSRLLWVGLPWSVLLATGAPGRCGRRAA